MTLRGRRVAGVALAVVPLIGKRGLVVAPVQGDAGLANRDSADETKLSASEDAGEANAKAIIEYRPARPFEARLS